MTALRLLLAVVATCLPLAIAADAAAAKVRIKDIANLQNVRQNQLVGYGLVIGLSGTGDGMRNSPFTEQSLRSMLDRMGVNVRAQNLRARNVAAVVVTAELPAFVGRGARIDVTVSSLGDATSLQGGTLVLTPLTGGDGKVYAVAQGPVTVSGFAAQGATETVVQGVPTSGRIANGAIVEREAMRNFAELSPLVLELFNPDFRTSARVADAINAWAQRRFGKPVALDRDLRSVALTKPPGIGLSRFMGEIGDLLVEPQTPARVVVDERTGTIVIGADVRVSTVAVTQGSLTVQVEDTPLVSQPLPFSDGETVVTPETSIGVDQTGGQLQIIEGADLRTLVGGLNRMGLKPNDIIAILNAIKTAGALQAELVVQ